MLASVLLLGAALVLLLRPPFAASLLLLFGLVQGHAHSTELSPGADLTYMAGLLVSTALLVGIGYAIGRVLHDQQQTALLRYAGATLLLGGIGLTL